MINLPPQPENHTRWIWSDTGQFVCTRCEWARLFYNLIHHVRTRQEHKI